MVIVDVPARRYPVHKGWLESMDDIESRYELDKYRKRREQASQPGTWTWTPDGWVFEKDERY